MNIWSSLGHETSESSMIDEDNNSETADFHKFEAAWQLLYSDCLSALETCVEGELKHFHKARYMLAQGLYRRGRTGDLDKAKEELSFCFKSSRSSFTINMWEIDSMVKRGRYNMCFLFNIYTNMKYLPIFLLFIFLLCSLSSNICDYKLELQNRWLNFVVIEQLETCSMKILSW